MRLDIGIFAHNEAGSIGVTLRDLARQTVFDDPELDLRVLVLANGCSDGTVAECHAVLADMPPNIAARIEVVDLPQGGKSRTANRYIHDLSRPGAEVLGFMDADIALPEPRSLAIMLGHLATHPDVEVINSRPVKDVIHYRMQVGPVARLIARGGDGLTDYRTTICGQLYLLRAPMARRIYLPVGLPVEDGFMRAMILTDLLTRPEDLRRIVGLPEAYHVYESIQTARALLRHQTRLVIGTAINLVVFQRLDKEAATAEQASSYLRQIAADEDWLGRVLGQDLPKWPYGYVPFSTLKNRFRGGRGRLRALPVAIAGGALDLVSYVLATWHMMRRSGAGFW